MESTSRSRRTDAPAACNAADARRNGDDCLFFTCSQSVKELFVHFGRAGTDVHPEPQPRPLPESECKGTATFWNGKIFQRLFSLKTKKRRKWDKMKGKRGEMGEEKEERKGRRGRRKGGWEWGEGRDTVATNGTVPCHN